MLCYYFQLENEDRIFVTSDSTTNKFSEDIVQPLSKRNRFSIGHCAKFVRNVDVQLLCCTLEGVCKFGNYR